MKKRGSYKRFKNFSKLLFNINFGQIHHLRNSKTFDKKESQKNIKQNSYSYLIDPEIEYVTQLNFYNLELPKEKNILYHLRTMPNFNMFSLNPENKNIREIMEEHKLLSNQDKFTNQIKENKLENKRRDLEI